MLTEVLFASVSALALGAGTLDLPLALGGGAIVGAALLAARGTLRDRPGPTPSGIFQRQRPAVQRAGPAVAVARIG